MAKTVLIVDDDDDLREIVKETLDNDAYEVYDADSGDKALKLMEENSYDLIISDLMMPGIKGLDLLKKVKEHYPQTGVLLMSAYGTIETAVDAMKEGAFDFITKPFSISHIESRVERFFEYESLKKENISLKKKLAQTRQANKLVGNSSVAEQINFHIGIVARSDAPVFLQGESGTGKELIAEAIHNQSDRSQKPFLKINCAAVPDTLFESTLFGHEKGAFSGAYKSQKGIFEECDGGTLLLDEVTEIPYNMQAKLLRVLQEMKIVRVGTTSEIPVDVRIIAATNHNITEQIREGKFREDLFFRLNVFPIDVAPLRHRKEDIPLLVETFLNNFKKKYKYTEKILDPSCMDVLLNYNWPGNIRQLQHVIERAILFSTDEPRIRAEHLKFEEDFSKGSKDAFSPENIVPLAEMEKRMIFAALQKTGNHRNQAAELLGITVRTLRNKLHQYEENVLE
ncbi:MAG TPA: sigma-54-dependent Fis family transcriptional regulator [Caldithrix abyssi]|uniref:Sigma-54-dependent Fis family transcriptional regulator n=1 Tax=Caldithrix abyssi TaxID=187145 RepID=A0A7V1LK72_CALAY|nr:sigma-54-dependent Fis family transcriptional regulator [Caldithrix abyssi]